MIMPSIQLKEKFELFDQYWTPKIIGECNGQLIKIAKLKGEFIWHNHQNEDELFYIVKGKLLMRYRTKDVQLEEGEIHIVPKSIDHLPVADSECWVMLIEPKGTSHTGDHITDKTVHESDQEWI